MERERETHHRQREGERRREREIRERAVVSTIRLLVLFPDCMSHLPPTPVCFPRLCGLAEPVCNDLPQMYGDSAACAVMRERERERKEGRERERDRDTHTHMKREREREREREQG